MAKFKLNGEEALNLVCGELPAFKIRGQWRVRRADFERWMTDKASNRAKSDEDEV